MRLRLRSLKLQVKREYMERARAGVESMGQDLVDQLFNSSEKRLARILSLLAHFGKEKVEPRLSSPESIKKTWRKGWAQPGRGSVIS